MKQRIAGVSVLAAVLVALFWPTLVWLRTAWFDNDYYSHGILLPFVSAYLLWNERTSLARPQAPGGWGLAVVGLGVGIHLGALLWSAYYLSALAIVIVLLGLALACYGFRSMRQLAFPIAFLLLAIPLPFVPLIATLLQGLTADSSTSLVQLLGVPATNIGSEVRLPTCSLIVGAPCSGMNSLITLVTLATLFIYIMQTSLKAMLGLALLVVPLALFGNIVRVASLLMVANQWGVDAGLRYYHDVSGWVFYALVLVLLGALAWGLGCRELRLGTSSSV